MAKQVRICRECWISVTPIPSPNRVIGIGNRTAIEYKHTSFRDPRGNPYCGKAVLTEPDTQWATPVSEDGSEI